MRLTLIDLKGGTGKTTSAVYLARGLGESGRTLLIDMEAYGSALSWSESAPSLPFVTIQMPVKDLHKRVDNLAQGYDHVVIDTPAIVRPIGRSALMSAQHAIIPISPSLLDIDRLNETLALIDEVEHTNDLTTSILLTRVRRGTKSAKATREALSEMGLHVLTAEIPLLETYAGAAGTNPSDLGEYADALEEIKELVQ
ncbi:ParA family partition ATPase [soil metagenome]